MMTKALGVHCVTRAWVESLRELVPQETAWWGFPRLLLSSRLSQLYQISPLARRVEEVSDLWVQ